MRLRMDQAPLLAVTRYAVEGKDYSLVQTLAIDLFLRRAFNVTTEHHLREDLGTTCQKRILRMVLYGSRWAMVKEVRMLEDLA